MTARDQDRWDDLRRRLASDNPWYAAKGDRGFSIADFNLDDLVYGRLSRLAKEQALRHCPYLFESLLSDVSQSLDNCLAYRRELFDLCTQATQRALEYQLFKDTVDPERQLALLGTIADQAQQESKLYASSSERFEGTNGIDPANVVAAGLNEISKGFSSVRKYVSGRETQKSACINQRYDATTNYQQRLELLHSADGSSLNYVQRVNRITPLILDEIEDAYRKSQSIVAGMNRVLDQQSWQREMPTVTRSGFLDEFIVWFRKLVRDYQIFSQNEVTWIKTFSFRHGAPLEEWTSTYRAAATGGHGFTFKVGWRQPPSNRTRSSRVVSVSLGLAKYRSSGWDTFANVTLPFKVKAPSMKIDGWESHEISEIFPNVTLATRDLFVTKGVATGANPIRNVPAGYEDEWIVQPLLDSDNGPVSGVQAPAPGNTNENWLTPELIPDDVYVQLRLKEAPVEE